MVAGSYRGHGPFSPSSGECVCKTSSLNGYKVSRANQKLQKKRPEAYRIRKFVRRLFTQTILWNLAKLVKIYSGIIVHQQHRRKGSVQGERRHLSDTSEVQAG